MTRATRPAAYVRLSDPNALASGARAYSLTDAAVRRGWPKPAIFIDEGRAPHQSGQALSRLTAAIEAGRYDALLLAGPASVMSSDSTQLMRLLRRCTRNGIPVVFVLPSDH